MSDFELTEDLLTGIDDVDEQHRMLLGLAADIVETPDEEKGVGFFERTSGFLKEYAAYHFASEEMVMLQHHYPKFEAHSKRHATIREELANLILKVRAEGLTRELNAQDCFFVEDWVLQHIRTFDREMATFYHAHNIQVSLPSASTVLQSDSQSGVSPSKIDDIMAHLKVRRR